MSDPTTANRSLAVPTRGSDVGTWDVPVNGDFTAIDTLFGGVVTKSASSSNITLSTSDIQNGIIRLTGVLSANIDLIFPTVQAYYTVENLTTGNFYVRCKMAAGQTVGVPQGKPTAIFTDGTNAKFQFPCDVGTYWDYAGGTTPAWIAACSVLPWLLCDGTVYNVSDYPYLGNLLLGVWGGNGVTTFAVPDLQNKVRASVKATSPLITTAVSGVDGATIGSSSTAQGVTLTTAQVPSSPLTGSGTVTPTVGGGIASGSVATGDPSTGFQGGSTSSAYNPTQYRTFDTKTVNITGTVTGGGGAHTSVQPTAIAGLTFIKT